MHRWSPHCALGWLQAELEEAEQEAEVRGGPAGPGTAGRETRPIIPPNPPPPRFILILQGGEPLLQEAHPECLAPGEPATLLSRCPHWTARLILPTCECLSVGQCRLGRQSCWDELLRAGLGAQCSVSPRR